MSMDDVAIRVSGVSKTFKLPHEKQTSVKSMFLNVFKGKRSYEKQHVLKDISFEIKKGEFFGIVGRNGSGKSTLLKLLAGIYTPDEGTIEVNGKLTPFIELGVGFNPELTGRENVFLNGALLGFNRKEMDAMYDEIVDFAELHKFMDQKLKNYSSGMQVRLAFSIAIRAKSDILLIDEVLAVGDANFQRKCFQVFNEIKGSNRTIIFISHDATSVKRYCDRAMLIESGKMLGIGRSEAIMDSYSEVNAKYIQKLSTKKNYNLEKSNKDVVIKDVTLLNINNEQANAFKPYEKIKIEVVVSAKKDYKNIIIRVAATQAGGGLALFVITSQADKTMNITLKKGDDTKVSFILDNIYNDCEANIKATVFDSSEQNMLADTKFDTKFVSLGWSLGIVGGTYPKTILQ